MKADLAKREKRGIRMTKRNSRYFLVTFVAIFMILAFPLAGLQIDNVYASTVVDAQVGASGDDGWVEYPTIIDNYSVFTKAGMEETYLRTFLRFTGITIPQGATITSCYISVYETTMGNGSPLTQIYFEKAQNPSQISGYNDYLSRILTGNYTEWDGPLSSDSWNNSPSLVTPMQELINTYGLGNQAIQVMWKPNDGRSSKNVVRTYDYSSSLSAKIHIEYTLTPSASPTIPSASSSAAGSNLAVIVGVAVGVIVVILLFLLLRRRR
jgi:hypothetical protein